ncbi:MAG TPA: tetratricopeptide repeat protein [Thermoanaerobaculia bacterium]|nr:tetratricopeptide repeat protein [Thermoanaerobaculia bacterium]
MAQPAINPKIEELRFRLKTDPKSRLFYQLAEELRRAGQFAEAEGVLRTGLLSYPTYLAAWVSLGRVLREQKNDASAVEALSKALQLDPGNVVAARLLADAYAALGEKLEAIKKYKLVQALLPAADEELRGVIEQLDRELGPPPAIAPPAADVPAFEEAPKAAAPEAPESQASAGEAPVAPQETPEPEPEPSVFEESPFDRTLPPFEEAEQSLGEEMRVENETADVEPMSREHDESPFEEPVEGFTAAAMEIEAPLGMQIVSAPLAADVPSFVEDELPAVDSTPVFDTASPSAAAETDDAASTITMADLYVRQGLLEDARHIYENILARDPGNAEVRGKLQAISPRVNPKVAALERWLAKVLRREVGRGL